MDNYCKPQYLEFHKTYWTISDSTTHNGMFHPWFITVIVSFNLWLEDLYKTASITTFDVHPSMIV